MLYFIIIFVNNSYKDQNPQSNSSSSSPLPY